MNKYTSAKEMPERKIHRPHKRGTLHLSTVRAAVRKVTQKRLAREKGDD